MSLTAGLPGEGTAFAVGTAAASTTIERLAREIRERGLRLTAPRRRIAEALCAADRPFSAADLSVALALNASSVYRNLRALEGVGLVRAVRVGREPVRYLLGGGEDRGYLSCDLCGELVGVSSTDLDPLRGYVRQRFGYEARFGGLAIRGHCPRCLAQTAPAGPSSRALGSAPG